MTEIDGKACCPELRQDADGNLVHLVRLNIGAGEYPLDGYENIDRQTGQEAYPLPQYADQSVDEVRASHILEHFPRNDVLRVLFEWARVLRVGGTLKIAVPDLQWIARSYLAGEDFDVIGYLYGAQSDSNDLHLCAFDEGLLTEMLEACGFEGIERWKSEIEDCASLPVSLNLQATKAQHMTMQSIPVDAEEEEGDEEPVEVAETIRVPMEHIGRDVLGLLSAPTLGYTSMMTCATNAFVPLHIQFRVGGGYSWGQTLSRLLDEAIEAGAKYALTLDYDSVFSCADVQRLYAIMEAWPQIDAVCPLQMNRHRDALMVTRAPGALDGKPHMVIIKAHEVDAETMPVYTGHFGLTMLRLETLKKLPRPWFWTKPDPNGGWNDGRVDDDIWFWHRWQEAGFNLHLANRVAIGHIQTTVNWPGPNLRRIYQTMEHYQKHGKPQGVWS